MRLIYYNRLQIANATVAQLVEQRIRNAQVVGSSPTSSSKNPVHFLWAGFSKITVYPDNPDEIKKCAFSSGLKLAEQCETEFAHIFVFEK